MNSYVTFQTVKAVAVRHYRVLPCSQFAGTRLRPRKLLDGIAQKTKNTPETVRVFPAKQPLIMVQTRTLEISNG